MEETAKAKDGANPLLVASPPLEQSVDRQIQTLLYWKGYSQFDQWRFSRRNGAPFRLRQALSQLLPTLMGARDYAGAAKVLAVMYQRFAVTPAICIEASLEIIRRQPDYRSDLLNFYETALENRRLDKMLLLKELFLFHIIHGEFYEAYHLYQDKIQSMEDLEHDARLLANFGVLCYWLLFIESKEIRAVLKREEIDEEEEGRGGLDGQFPVHESIESVIESTYLFKTPIGVHILYQHASGALRRAVALCPESAIFVEYTAQLLVLVGDIQSACDYLESFFHAHPTDPHGARMLSGFLEKYYPDSVDAQVAVYIRWMKADPACNYALEKVLELSSAGAISSYTLTKTLVEALDVCGSDLYVIQNPQVALKLWRNLAELLTAMDDEEFLMVQVDGNVQETIADISAQRLWWKRVFFCRPSTVDEVVSLSNSSAALMEVSIYRAAVAKRFYPGLLALPEALRSAMTSSSVTINRDYQRLFKSFFSHSSVTATARTADRSFYDMSFINLIVEDQDKIVPFPAFSGDYTLVDVMTRKSMVKTASANNNAIAEVTHEDGHKEVDSQLVNELLDALEGEVRSIDPVERAANNVASTLIPAYVDIVEDEAYSYPDATPRHIYTMVSHKLALSDMVVPTFKQVLRLIRFFRLRWNGNLIEYGHRGVSMRYEFFLAKFVLQQRKKSEFEITKNVVKEATEEMKRVFSCSHPHFPDENLVELVMCNKMSSFARQRRVRLTEVRKALRPILKQFIYVNEKELAAAAWSVCKANGLEGVVTHEDIICTLQSLLPGHYFWVIEAIDPRVQRSLASPEIRGTSNDPERIMHIMKTRHRYTRLTIPHIQAIMWMERYEAAHGRLVEDDSEFWERGKYRFINRKRARKQGDNEANSIVVDDETEQPMRRKRNRARTLSDSDTEEEDDAGEADEAIPVGNVHMRRKKNGRVVDKAETDGTSEDDDDGDSDYTVE